MTDSPHSYWDKLRVLGKGDGRDEIASHVGEPETGYGPVRFSLGEEREPRFLVPCGSMKGSVHEYSTSALAVTKKRLRLRDRESCFIDLQCKDSALTGVFSELVNEVIGRLESGEAPETAVTGAITDFRALLIAGSSREVPRESVLGLLGEMIVAERLVEQDADALKCWLGPGGERHDFRSSVNALEVKTLSRPAASEISISSLDQLLPLANGRLILVVVWLDQAAEGATTVGAVADRILAKGGDRELLLEGLLKLGCASPNDDAWNGHRFEFGDLQGYEVKPGFPRITGEEMVGGVIPAGINRLNYSISLGNMAPYRLSDEDLESFFTEMAR